jgi:hypothetical protein
MVTQLSSLHDCGHPEGYPKRSQHETDREADVRRRLNVYSRITDGIKDGATQKDDHDSAGPQADCRRAANPTAPHVVRNQSGEEEADRDLPDVAEPNSEVTSGNANEESDNLAHSVTPGMSPCRTTTVCARGERTSSSNSCANNSTFRRRCRLGCWVYELY